MDTIDLFVSFAAFLVILNIIVQLGTDCATAVWQRTTATLDELDLLEGNTVPMTSSFEAALIVIAAVLKSLGMLPFTLYLAFSQQTWRLSPAARLARLRMSLKSDILLAVSSMISGYPERATLLYLDALRERVEAVDGKKLPTTDLIA